MKVTLEAITIDNFEALMDMELPPEQAACPDARRITICYQPANVTDRRFYASLGFAETGIDARNEMVAAIHL